MVILKWLVFIGFFKKLFVLSLMVLMVIFLVLWFVRIIICGVVFEFNEDKIFKLFILGSMIFKIIKLGLNFCNVYIVCLLL